MNIQFLNSSRKQASALISTFSVIAILCVSIAGYLSYVQHQRLLSFRSQSWNLALPVVEAGIEDGLQHLNINTSQLGKDGWADAGSSYKRTLDLDDGNQVQVKIDVHDPCNPVVTAKALVTPAACMGSQNTQPINRVVEVRCQRSNLLLKGMVAKQGIDMNGNNILTDSFNSADPAWSNQGRYDPAKTKANGDIAVNSSFRNSLSIGNANIHGHVIVGPGGNVAVGPKGGVGTAAWIAANPGKIQAGYFKDDANYTFPDQVLPYSAAVPPISGSISVTNYTFSSNGVTSTTCPNPIPFGGVITNKTFATSTYWPNKPNTTTNVAGWNYVTTANYPAPGTTFGPITTNFAGNGSIKSYNYALITVVSYTYPTYNFLYNLYTTNFTVTTTYYDNILSSGDYMILGDLRGKTLVLGNARLVVSGGINMSGNDVLQIGQFGCLQLFVGADSTIAGNGVINQEGFAGNCQVFCLPTVKNISFSGNGEFIGVIVAPSADVTMNGGGNSINDFIGAIMANSIRMNGHFQFHFDEALAAGARSGRFITTTWNELHPETQL